jgi:hypothetical protein
MKIVLAIALNGALLAWLLPWLRRQWQWAESSAWKAVLGVGLGLRLAMGGARHWHPQDDARFMGFVSRIVSDKMKAAPTATWDILTRSVTVLPKGDAAYDFVFQNTSNTWILIKILALLNFASLETDGINALYLSIFAFVGCWQLVRALVRCFPQAPAGAGAVAFLLWPTICFWASGLSKEAVLLGSGAWLTARIVAYCYGPGGSVVTRITGPGWWSGTAGLVLLHFGMRYFFAVPLLLVLSGIALGYGLAAFPPLRHRWVQAAALSAVLGLGGWLLPQAGVAFSFNKFTNQVITVYNHELAAVAGRPHFEYPDLRPTLESIISYAPQAALNVITRPWPGESWRPLYMAASLENAALLTLLFLAGWATLKKKAGHLPFGLGLGLAVFCIMLAVLMGLTTPNLGSLNRYRSGLLPFLLLLLLQNDYAATLLARLGLNTPLAKRKPSAAEMG